MVYEFNEVRDKVERVCRIRNSIGMCYNCPMLNACYTEDRYIDITRMDNDMTIKLMNDVVTVNELMNHSFLEDTKFIFICMIPSAKVCLVCNKEQYKEFANKIGEFEIIDLHYSGDYRDRTYTVEIMPKI